MPPDERYLAMNEREAEANSSVELAQSQNHMADYWQYVRPVANANMEGTGLLPELQIHDPDESRTFDITGRHSLAEITQIANDPSNPNRDYALAVIHSMDFLQANGVVSGAGDSREIDFSQIQAEVINDQIYLRTPGPYRQNFVDGAMLWLDSSDRVRRIEQDGKIQTIEYDGDRVSRYVDADGRAWTPSPYLLWHHGQYTSDPMSDNIYDSIVVQDDGVVILTNSDRVTLNRGALTASYPNQHVDEQPYWDGDGIVAPLANNQSAEYQFTNGILKTIQRDEENHVTGTTEYDIENQIFTMTDQSGLSLSLTQYEPPGNIYFDGYPIYIPGQDMHVVRIGYPDGSVVSIDPASGQWTYRNAVTNETYRAEQPTLNSVDVTEITPDTYVIQMAAPPGSPEGQHGAQATFRTDGTLIEIRGLNGSTNGRVTLDGDSALIVIPGDTVAYERRDGVWIVHSTDPTSSSLAESTPNPAPQIELVDGRFFVELPDGRRFTFGPDGIDTRSAYDRTINNQVIVHNQTQLYSNPTTGITWLPPPNVWVELPDGSSIRFNQHIGDANEHAQWELYGPSSNGSLGPFISAVSPPAIEQTDTGPQLRFGVTTSADQLTDFTFRPNVSYDVLLETGAVLTVLTGGAKQSIERPDGSRIIFDENGRETSLELVNSNGTRVIVQRQPDGSWSLNGSPVTVDFDPDGDLNRDDYYQIKITDASGNYDVYTSDYETSTVEHHNTTLTDPELGNTDHLENDQVTNSTTHTFPDGSSIALEDNHWVYTAENQFKVVLGEANTFTTDDQGGLYFQGARVQESGGAIALSLGGGVTLYQEDGLVTRIQYGGNNFASINFENGLPVSITVNEGDIDARSRLLGNASSNTTSITIDQQRLRSWMANSQNGTLEWVQNGVTITISPDLRTITATRRGVTEQFTASGVTIEQ